jgi:hypothetical protein
MWYTSFDYCPFGKEFIRVTGGCRTCGTGARSLELCNGFFALYAFICVQGKSLLVAMTAAATTTTTTTGVFLLYVVFRSA